MFQCSDLGDSSSRRTLSTLTVMEYNESVSNMESRYWEMGISNCSECKIGKLTSLA